jgi:TPR repeat protein
MGKGAKMSVDAGLRGGRCIIQKVGPWLIMVALIVVLVLRPASSEALDVKITSPHCSNLDSQDANFEQERGLCDAYRDFANARYAGAELKLEKLLKGDVPEAQYLMATMIRRGNIGRDDSAKFVIYNMRAVGKGLVEAKVSQALMDIETIVRTKPGKRTLTDLFESALKFAPDILEAYPDIGHWIKAHLYYISVNKKYLADLPEDYIYEAVEARVADAMFLLSAAIENRQIDAGHSESYLMLFNAAIDGHLEAEFQVAKRHRFFFVALFDQTPKQGAKYALRSFAMAEAMGHPLAATEQQKIISEFPDLKHSELKDWVNKKLKERFGDSDTEIGRASIWCKETGLDPRNCMPTARQDHSSCFDRMPKKYFARNFEETMVYHQCRKNKLATSINQPK